MFVHRWKWPSRKGGIDGTGARKDEWQSRAHKERGEKVQNANGGITFFFQILTKN